MADHSSIEHVQDAEAKAKKVIEDAEKSKAEKIEKASQKAKQIIEEAEAKAKPIRENAVKKASVELEKERESRLLAARSEAKKLQSRQLSKNAAKSIIDKLVRQIFS